MEPHPDARRERGGEVGAPEGSGYASGCLASSSAQRA
jgi:hypothetical protein